MTLQEIILNKLHAVKRNELIASQLKEASEILERNNKIIVSWELATLLIDDLIPTQSDEDYQNPSSIADAELLLRAKTGLVNLNDIRLDSFRPIAVEKFNLNIIDGNHRHYAIKHIGEHHIYSLLCEVKINQSTTI